MPCNLRETHEFVYRAGHCDTDEYLQKYSRHYNDAIDPAIPYDVDLENLAESPPSDWFTQPVANHQPAHHQFEFRNDGEVSRAPSVASTGSNVVMQQGRFTVRAVQSECGLNTRLSNNVDVPRGRLSRRKSSAYYRAEHLRRQNLKELNRRKGAFTQTRSIQNEVTTVQQELPPPRFTRKVSSVSGYFYPLNNQEASNSPRAQYNEFEKDYVVENVESWPIRPSESSSNTQKHVQNSTKTRSQSVTPQTHPVNNPRTVISPPTKLYDDVEYAYHMHDDEGWPYRSPRSSSIIPNPVPRSHSVTPQMQIPVKVATSNGSSKPYTSLTPTSASHSNHSKVLSQRGSPVSTTSEIQPKERLPSPTESTHSIDSVSDSGFSMLSVRGMCFNSENKSSSGKPKKSKEKSRIEQKVFEENAIRKAHDDAERYLENLHLGKTDENSFHGSVGSKNSVEPNLVDYPSPIGSFCGDSFSGSDADTCHFTTTNKGSMNSCGNSVFSEGSKSDHRRFFDRGMDGNRASMTDYSRDMMNNSRNSSVLGDNLSFNSQTESIKTTTNARHGGSIAVFRQLSTNDCVQDLLSYRINVVRDMINMAGFFETLKTVNPVDVTFGHYFLIADNAGNLTRGQIWKYQAATKEYNVFLNDENSFCAVTIDGLRQMPYDIAATYDKPLFISPFLPVCFCETCTIINNQQK